MTKFKHRESYIGQAAEDYLKTIFHLQAESGETNTMAVARTMGVSGASVTAMVKKLSSRKLLKHDRYQGIALTEAGRKAALEVIRHHRLLELFLSKNLGYGLADVHDEADELEHAISERFERMMDAALGNPKIDPHGHAIPDMDGKMASRTGRPLSDLAENESAVVQTVLSHDSERLSYLERLRILPGTSVTVVRRKPLAEHVVVRVGASKRTEEIGESLAREIRVERIG